MAGRALPDHLKVPWKITDAVVVFLAAWIVLPVLVVLGLRLTSPVAPMAADFIRGLLRGDIGSSFALVLIDAVAALVLLLAYLRRYRAKWTAVGWRRFDVLKAAGYLLAIFIIFVVVANAALWLVGMLAPGFDANEAQSNEFLTGAGSHRSLALIALVVLPPVIEETVFRGFIFPAFAKHWGLWGGAVASSILFGIAHLQANVSIYTFLLGVLLCFMYARLGSILPGMILHMLNNYLAFLALTAK